jgi:hypothetical protein
MAQDARRNARLRGRWLAAADIARPRQHRFKLRFHHRLDEFAHPLAHPHFNRIKPTSKTCGDVSAAGGAQTGFVISLVMAWSPARRFNAG